MPHHRVALPAAARQYACQFFNRQCPSSSPDQRSLHLHVGRNSCRGGSRRRTVTRSAFHRFIDALKVASLHRQKLRQRFFPLFVCLAIRSSHVRQGFSPHRRTCAPYAPDRCPLRQILPPEPHPCRLYRHSVRTLSLLHIIRPAHDVSQSLL